MSSRLLPLLGPAVVLYLVADVAASAGGLDVVGAIVAASAVLAALAPIGVRSRTEQPGAKRVALLGVAAGVALVSAIDGGLLAVAVDVSGALATALGGALVIDLALTTPDRPPALARPGLRAIAWLGALAAAGLGLIAILPPIAPFGAPWILPSKWSAAPTLFAGIACITALGLRAARRRLGSSPDAIASSLWAQLGLWPVVLAAFAIAAAEVFAPVDHDAVWVRGVAAFAALALVGGHLFMIDAERRLAAGRATRRAVASAVTLAIAAAALAPLRSALPEEPLTFALSVAATLLAAVGVYRAVTPVVSTLLAPFGGRLLAAVDEALATVGTVTRLEDLARTLLGAMRRGSGSIDGEALLYTASPPMEARIDAAGEPHVRRRELPESIVVRLRERPGEVIVRSFLEATVVRRPQLRPLVESLVLIDALCVVPLMADGELEGILIVPRGRRRSALTLEEIAALQRLADRLAGLCAVLGANARAQERAAASSTAQEKVQDRADDLQMEIERLRADARVLKAGAAADRLNAPPIAYSPPMRGLVKRIEDVGSHDAPVLIVAEGGTFVDQIGHLVHQASGRAGGALVIADCGAVRPERTEAALFGEEGGDGAHPGWLRLAAGGSLLLVDVPALSPAAQHALGEAVAARQARPIGGTGSYPLDARIIATSRLDLTPLVDAGAFDPELARWLSPLRLEVPPLRDRREDVPSLVLLALDRACRVLGRPVVGIDPEALEVLLAHDWPGNLRELQSVIDRAVARAEGTKVTRKDLPPLARGVATAEGTEREEGDPLVGTYTALEKRILERALERAAGNKSEAARLLGLKRTTFLDKLRRHRIEENTRSEDAA